MNSQVVWKKEMLFEGHVGGNTVPLDAKAPFGHGTAPTPKELVALGLAGCTAMDVISLLKKHKQPPLSFEVSAEVTSSEGKQPVVFESAVLSYVVTGAVESAILMEAVRLSQTKYCGVSAMLSASFPIRYRVELNGLEVGQGKAEFASASE